MKRGQVLEKEYYLCWKDKSYINRKIMSRKNYDSRNGKFTNQESENLRCSNNKYNKTNYSNTPQRKIHIQIMNKEFMHLNNQINYIVMYRKGDLKLWKIKN